MKPKQQLKAKYYTSDAPELETIISGYEIYPDRYNNIREDRGTWIFRQPTVAPCYNVLLKNAVLLTENMTANVFAYIQQKRESLKGETYWFSPEKVANTLVRASEGLVKTIKKNIISIELTNITEHRITLQHDTLLGIVTKDKKNLERKKNRAIPGIKKSCKLKWKPSKIINNNMLEQISPTKCVTLPNETNQDHKISRPYNKKTAGGNRKGASERKRLKRQILRGKPAPQFANVPTILPPIEVNERNVHLPFYCTALGRCDSCKALITKY